MKDDAFYFVFLYKLLIFIKLIKNNFGVCRRALIKIIEITASSKKQFFGCPHIQNLSLSIFIPEHPFSFTTISDILPARE